MQTGVGTGVGLGVGLGEAVGLADGAALGAVDALAEADSAALGAVDGPVDADDACDDAAGSRVEVTSDDGATLPEQAATTSIVASARARVVRRISITPVLRPRGPSAGGSQHGVRRDTVQGRRWRGDTGP